MAVWMLLDMLLKVDFIYLPVGKLGTEEKANPGPRAWYFANLHSFHWIFVRNVSLFIHAFYSILTLFSWKIITALV